MPHPIYGTPNHQLEVVEIKLWLPTKRNGRRARVTAQGTCETKRGPLWTYSEQWAPDELQAMLQPADAIHHLALCVAQDRPSTSEALEAAMGAPGFEDVPLPF